MQQSPEQKKSPLTIASAGTRWPLMLASVARIVSVTQASKRGRRAQSLFVINTWKARFVIEKPDPDAITPYACVDTLISLSQVNALFSRSTRIVSVVPAYASLTRLLVTILLLLVMCSTCYPEHNQSTLATTIAKQNLNDTRLRPFSKVGMCGLCSAPHNQISTYKVHKRVYKALCCGVYWPLFRHVYTDTTYTACSASLPTVAIGFPDVQPDRVLFSWCPEAKRKKKKNCSWDAGQRSLMTTTTGSTE